MLPTVAELRRNKFIVGSPTFCFAYFCPHFSLSVGDATESVRLHSTLIPFRIIGSCERGRRRGLVRVEPIWLLLLVHF